MESDQENKASGPSFTGQIGTKVQNSPKVPKTSRNRYENEISIDSASGGSLFKKRTTLGLQLN